MKVSKEFKVGLLTLAGLVLLYLGFNYLKGSNVFSSTKEYNLSFDDVLGLEVSNTVNYKGVVVGRVTKIVPDYESGLINVLISLKKEVKVTDKTSLTLADDGLLGGKILILKTGPGNDVPSGSILPSDVEHGLIDMVTDKLDPTLQNVDTLVYNLNKVIKEFEHSGEALKALMAGATQSTVGLNNIMAANSKNLNAVTGNAAVLTTNLNRVVKDLDIRLKPILANAGSFTDSLKTIELSATVASLNRTISELQSVVNEINAGEGTLGKLAVNDSLYQNLNNTAESLNHLMVDLKENPKRYVHFSLFGRKNKK